jgi:hypothetical protein
VRSTSILFAILLFPWYSLACCTYPPTFIRCLPINPLLPDPYRVRAQAANLRSSPLSLPPLPPSGPLMAKMAPYYKTFNNDFRSTQMKTAESLVGTYRTICALCV